MEILQNPLYAKDVEYVAGMPFDWDRLSGKSILISGAGGMIGSFLIDVIMQRNVKFKNHCSVIALARDQEKAKRRFKQYWDSENFEFFSHDINNPLTEIKENKTVDYIVHAASNTHPRAYAVDPVGTVITNIIGTYNLLEFAAEHKTERFVFLSSVEVYGENRGDTEKFTESYCGYIDSNTLRAGYPEGKRAGEALCQAYIRQKGIDVVIPRLSRTYGPTMLMTDSKAISQFIKKGIAKEDIVLKSEGTQFYSYSYVADAVAGILTVLFNGICGEAYNIADERSDITLRDLAGLIAGYADKKVVFELPDETERAGYSKATKAVMDASKLKQLGWEAGFDIQDGLKRTMDILQMAGGNVC